jgi:hypothetical protein
MSDKASGFINSSVGTFSCAIAAVPVKDGKEARLSIVVASAKVAVF